jgi:hypothetical protein
MREQGSRHPERDRRPTVAMFGSAVRIAADRLDRSGTEGAVAMRGGRHGDRC